MIVVMRANATSEQVSSVERYLAGLGLGAHTIVGEQRTVIGAIGDKRDGVQQSLEKLDGVERVVPILQPYKLAGRELKKADSIIEAGGVKIGGGSLVVAAGPCAVEGEEQIMEIARSVKKAGASILRGGAFKPRTSPYSFQGLQEEGLKLIRKAADAVHMPTVTEVMDARDVELVAEYSEILQIGARNMQNFTLLREVGKAKKPVMLKRGLAATIDEWLMAAEYILSEGNYQVILCERGIRTYETATRNTLDISAVPLLKSLSHLPVFIDPSHAAGRRNLVAPLSRAAVAAGADGLIIEVHSDPANAVSDGAQSLEPDEFSTLIPKLSKLHDCILSL